MSRIKANKKVLMGLITLMVVVLFGGYMYWRNIYISSQNTDNPAITPTQSNDEIPFPTPIVISPIPTPEDIDSWLPSSPSVDYQWSFKYPPTWTEKPIIKTNWAYHPLELAPEDYSLNFFKGLSDWQTPEQHARSTSVGNDDTPVIKHEIFQVNDRTVEMIISTKIEDNVVTLLRIQSFIKDVDFIDGHNPGQCIENGMLIISATYKHPPFFSPDNIPYENDIKQMLATFEITDCVPSN